MRQNMAFDGKAVASLAQDAASFAKCMQMTHRFLIYLGLRGIGRE